MPLEILDNPERINIKHLSNEIAEKKPELRFDPKRDLTEEDWDGMVRQVHSSMEDASTSRETVASLAAALFKLDRQQAAFFFAKRDYDDIFFELASFRALHNWWGFARLASAYVVIFPQRARDLGLTPTDWSAMKDTLADDIRVERWNLFKDLAAYSTITGHDPAVALVKAEDWQKISDKLGSYRQENWQTFISAVANLAVIDPQRALALLGPSDWPNMLNVLSKDRDRENYGSFAFHAADLTVLSQVEMKFRTEGSPQETAPPLPEIRNF